MSFAGRWDEGGGFQGKMEGRESPLIGKQTASASLGSERARRRLHSHVSLKSKRGSESGAGENLARNPSHCHLSNGAIRSEPSAAIQLWIQISR